MPRKTIRKTESLKKEQLELIENLANSGMTNEEIILCLPFARSTFYRRKKLNPEIDEAIKKGKVKAHANISNKLYETAMTGNVAAIIWYEKTRRGLTDKVAVDADVTSRRLEVDQITLNKIGKAICG